MYSYNQMEFITHERCKALHQEAEKARLVKAAQQQPNEQKASWKVRNWLGTQMVNWGLKLQGYHIGPPSQVPIPRTTKCS